MTSIIEPVNATSAAPEIRPLGTTAKMPIKKRVRSLVQLGFWAPGMVFVRRCSEAGVAVHLLRVSAKGDAHERVSTALASDGGCIRWEEIGTEAGLDRIVAFVHSVEADALCAVDEFSLYWLAQNRHRFEPRCTVMASPAHAIHRLMEKSEQTLLAKAAGFQLLDTWLLHTPADEQHIPESAFPICIRPTRMNSVLPSFKALRIDSRSALREFLASTRWNESPLLAQPWCLGPNIVLHVARTPAGKITAMQGFRAYRKFQGFALSLERCELSGAVIDAALRFAQLSEIDGPFHFDLIESAATDEIFFLEVNYRMGGTTAKAVSLGYDEPMYALEAYGLAAPHMPAPLRGSRRVTSKRMLIAQLFSALKRAPGGLDFPHGSRLWIIATAVVEFFRVPDALLSLKDLRGSLWYLRRGGRM